MLRHIIILISLTGLAMGYSGGDGSSAAPYQISSAADFLELSSSSGDWSSNFVLTSDIDLTGQELLPTGTSSQPFYGTFNGQGFAVSGLSINRSDLSLLGLFGMIGDDAIVENLTLSGTVVCSEGGWVYGGLLAGANRGFILNCAVNGTVSIDSSTSYSGGIAGSNENLGVISESSFSGTVFSNSTSGGAAGVSEGLIDKCAVSATIIARDNPAGFVYAGGIAGINGIDGAIKLCSSKGVVDASVNLDSKNTTSYAGGLAGYCDQYSSIRKSGTDCEVNSFSSGLTASAFAGGAVGQSNAETAAEKSFASNSVSAEAEGQSSYSYSGGFFGQSGSNVSDCFALGSAESLAAGSPDIGLSGGFIGNCSEGEISNCYSAGQASGKSDSTAGFIAKTSAGQGDACFWDTEASGLENATARNEGGSFDITGLATAQMQSSASFTDAGWDFASVWQMPAGGGYPELQEAAAPQNELAELTITSPGSLPENIFAGQLITLDASIQNSGAASTNGSFRMRIYYSSQQSVNCETASSAGFQQVSELEAGETRVESFSFEVPDFTGDIYFVLMIDSGRSVEESDETNNCSDVLSSQIYAFSGGTGTPEDPFQISDKSELLYLADRPSLYSKSYILTDDINMGGEFFDNSVLSPNDQMQSSFTGAKFTGTFDGAGRVLSNFTINAPYTSYAGLFGAVAAGGEIRNLHISQAEVRISRANYAGGFAGLLEGKITGCSIKDSSVNAEYISKYAGGIAGSAEGSSAEISNCSSAAMEEIIASMYAGGIAGEVSSGGLIQQCFCAAEELDAAYYAGPLAGAVRDSQISSSYWDSTIIPSGSQAEPAAGLAENAVITAYARTTEQMKTRSNYAGWQWRTLWHLDPGNYPILISRVDVNLDNYVDEDDLIHIAYNWLSQNPEDADFNRDGIVDIIDCSIAANWWLSEY
ncbi:CARDB domain-containing protein [Sedimentisphaera salicampi]|uniref:CARDB domain-containing protein n=1 Tax=Sedimentisphaera salicampi TaxID=1941349 RepID=A0A1W6LNG9_9BACT|nr:CARDB domain-containing protein [Sedimentisphaera salicampi]ARN57292.1 hypothetical protein STSP1_01695 [Sedimentisphaera salicampi]